MELSPSALQDAKNLRVAELNTSIPRASSPLKDVYQKFIFYFRSRYGPKRRGMTFPREPIEVESEAGVKSVEEERLASVNENFVNRIVECSIDDVPTAHNTNSSGVGLSAPIPLRVDKCSPQPSVPSSSSSASAMYSSRRIDRRMQTRRTYSTDLEFEIESSKDHWSVVAPLSDDSELVAQDPQAFLKEGIFAGEKFTERELEFVRDVCNGSLDSKTREEQLMHLLYERWASRFDSKNPLKKLWVGEKIGEGAQAEIFAVEAKHHCSDCHPKGVICRDYGIPSDRYVLKVFKKGYRVRDLQRIWRKEVVTGYSTLYTCPIRRGYLLPNGRFAFLMPRYWGDLRRFLDRRMEVRLDSTYPPCSDWEATRSMLYIAKGMRDLHISDIVHRDLKASNVLVEMIVRTESEMEKIRNIDVDTFYCRVTDFESSKGVLGTRFWRAPEILLAVKNRCLTEDIKFTKESDVYSYAMTCYEIWTGRFPFEDLKDNDYDTVIKGERPILPPCLKPWIRDLLESCWHADPSQRPTFKQICDTITSCTQDASGKCMDGDGEEFEMTIESSDSDGTDCKGLLRNAMWSSWLNTPKSFIDENKLSFNRLPTAQYATCLCRDCFSKWVEEFVVNKRVNTIGG